MATIVDAEIDSLQAQIKEMIASNEQLMRENEVFESYLVRNVANPEDLIDQEEDDTRKGRFAKKGAKKARAKTVTLTWDQKLDMARGELDQVKKDAAETEKNSGRMIDTLKAVLEQTDVRIAELKKEAYEFKRDIVVGAENFRTGKTMAEKVVRYMEDKLRAKDSVIEKLRLKNASLKTALKKLQSQLLHKQETGDVLHYIDFHQLQIENTQYAAKIEERTQELMKLKLTSGNIVQTRNTLMHELGELIKEVADLKGEIEQRTELLGKLHTNNAAVTADIAKAKKACGRLKSQAEDNAGMPQVIDFIGQKAKEYELQREVLNWERKVEIAKMAANRYAARRAPSAEPPVM